MPASLLSLLLTIAAVAPSSTASLHATLSLQASHVAEGRIGLDAARAVARPKLPPRADADGDGLDNGIERYRTGTNPRKFDSDGDGFDDGTEVSAGSNPRRAGSTPPPNQEPPTSTEPFPESLPPFKPPPPPPPPVDVTVPQTTVTSGPAGTTTSTGANFTFRSSENGSSFQCSLDSSEWANCTSPRFYSSLTLGSHTFAVRATDAAGNADASPATWEWSVEAPPPPDTTPPNTSILFGPEATTTSTSARFTFSSSESGATFECSLDSGAWVKCTSSRFYSGLATGAHTFVVKAVDAAGNADASPATWEWSVEPPTAPDTTPPETTIDSGPPATTTSTNADFTFSSNDDGATFQCSLDDGAWEDCASPMSYGSLGLGSHTFAVQATDSVGNADATPATLSWSVEAAPDITPPNTSIVSGPPSFTTDTGASFGFTASESDSTFQCSLDSGPWVSCTSPQSYGGLAVGSHAFAVRATDGAGNPDATPATRSWQVTEPEAPVACTTVLSPGANVADAISRASGGATICLRGGSYGRISASGARKSPAVTVRSNANERASVAGITLTDPVGLRFVALDITGGTTITPSGSNLQFIDNDITGVAGVYFFGDYRIGKRIENVLFEGNRIHDIDYTGTQQTGYGYGIEGVGDTRHVVIRNNTIKSPASDYIQSASPTDWVVDRNTFLGPSLLGSHADHQDLWQIFGGGEEIAFTNNVARNTQTHESLLFQEGAFRDVVIENNLFDHDSRGYTCQLYQSSGMVFRNNTVVGSHWGCLFRDLASSAPGSGYEVDHNIFAGTEANADVSTEGRAGGWGTYDYNVSSDGSAGGSHSVRNWSPSWADTTSYGPLGLPFTAGFRP